MKESPAADHLVPIDRYYCNYIILVLQKIVVIYLFIIYITIIANCTNPTVSMTNPHNNNNYDFPMDIISNRKIIVALSGGIACYKIADLVSKLVQAGGDVSVLMTESATKFITPLTFQALSGKPVYTSPWQHIQAYSPQHISHADNTDLLLIAPCTMDTIARLAAGRADDVITLVTAAINIKNTPVLLAPSMNTTMWLNTATQRNITQLINDGYHTIGPDDGWQACRTKGPGRMSEPHVIIKKIIELLKQKS